MEKRLFRKRCRDTSVSNESKLAVDTWQREREKEREERGGQRMNAGRLSSAET